jgi:uncharacterized protein with HEPN domain
LEIIGEAVKQLPEEVFQRHPDIQWKRIAAMRDKLIHFYFGVDAHLVWQTIQTRLPELKSVVMVELREYENRWRLVLMWDSRISVKDKAVPCSPT